MSQHGLAPKELEDLKRALNSGTKEVNIRLREGEYQFSLAQTIASSELELVFLDAKALIRKLYGDKRAEDSQFVAKIQTILKKMEKMGIVRIFPKEKPWELQRYALTSFKFLDVERNAVSFATEDEIEKTKKVMDSQLKSERATIHQPKNMNLQLPLLVAIIAVFLSLAIWTLTQSPINLAIFITAFSAAAVSSMILGVLIAKK